MIAIDFEWNQLNLNDCKGFQLISICLNRFPMISNDIQWVEHMSNGVNWFQMVLSDFKCCRLALHNLKRLQMFSNDVKWFRMSAIASDVRWSQVYEHAINWSCMI